MSEGSRLAALRARIELPVLRRVSGALDGRHRSFSAGRGQDFDDVVEYHPGDSVSDIDWKSSARSGLPVIKRFENESNLHMILAVDTGRTMGALAPSGQSKEKIALEAASILAYLALSRGDQVGLVAGDSRRLRQLPARNGNAHLELILRYLEHDIDLNAPVSNTVSLLERVFSSVRRRSLIVILTDTVNPPPLAQQVLRRIRTVHEVMVISVADANPTDLEESYEVIDVEGGPLPDFVVVDPALRQQAHLAASSRQEAVQQMLARLGIQAVTLDSMDAIIPALIDILGRHKRAYS